MIHRLNSNRERLCPDTEREKITECRFYGGRHTETGFTTYNYAITPDCRDSPDFTPRRHGNNEMVYILACRTLEANGQRKDIVVENVLSISPERLEKERRLVEAYLSNQVPALNYLKKIATPGLEKNYHPLIIGTNQKTGKVEKLLFQPARVIF